MVCVFAFCNFRKYMLMWVQQPCPRLCVMSKIESKGKTLYLK